MNAARGSRSFRALALLTDAFGGHGGIALYNRDLLAAVCSHPACTEVVAIPRLMPNLCEPLPRKLTHITAGLNSKARYAVTLLKVLATGGRFDLIICGHLHLLPLAWLASRIWRAPLLLEIYGIDAWQPTGNRLMQGLVDRVDAVVSISRVTSERFLTWASPRQAFNYLFPNAIHLERYGVGPKAPELLRRYGLAGKTVLMTFGRLVSSERAKGFDEVLQLLPELALEYPDIAYLIAGDGPDRPRLELKAEELGVAGRVVFTGMVPEAEKADLYRLADLYVMPSRGEGFGFVFLEAMACGIPVIASRVDGSREAVRDGLLGALVDPNNPEELKQAIRDGLSAGRGVIPSGLDYFSFQHFIRRVHGAVSELLASRGCYCGEAGADRTPVA